MQHWYILCYSTVPPCRLVLLCTGTYYLVQRFTILRISSFRFGTSYVESWTAVSGNLALSSSRRTKYRIENQADQRAEPGTGWTSAELNHILHAIVVDGALTTFGCVEWESQLFRGVMRARCHPFNLPKKRFHSFNPQPGHRLAAL